MVPKHGDSQKIIRDGSKLQRWMPWGDHREYQEKRIRNVTIRKQIGLEETIIKEIEQNQLAWYSHVQRMAEGRLPKIALKWMPKQKRAWERLKKNWMEGIRKAMKERNLNEGQWEDRKQWSLGVGQHRKVFWNRYIYIYIHTYTYLTPWRQWCNHWQTSEGTNFYTTFKSVLCTSGICDWWQARCTVWIISEAIIRNCLPVLHFNKI